MWIKTNSYCLLYQSWPVFNYFNLTAELDKRFAWRLSVSREVVFGKETDWRKYVIFILSVDHVALICFMIGWMPTLHEETVNKGCILFSTTLDMLQNIYFYSEWQIVIRTLPNPGSWSVKICEMSNNSYFVFFSSISFISLLVFAKPGMLVLSCLRDFADYMHLLAYVGDNMWYPDAWPPSFGPRNTLQNISRWTNCRRYLKHLTTSTIYTLERE